MLVVQVLKLFVLIERPLSIYVVGGQAREGDGVRGLCLILVWCKAFCGGSGLFV